MRAPFAERVKALRSRRGLTCAALAHRIGVSRPTLWAWETGRGHPRAENIKALAEALAVSDEYLKYGTEPEARETESGNVQSVIAEAKIRIAKLAGVEPDQVSIVIQY